MIYAVFNCLIFGAFMVAVRDYIINVFTEEEAIRVIGKRLFWVFMVRNILDFWQCSLTGIIRGLGKQDFFTKISFFSYFMMMIPFSMFLAFKQGSHSADYSSVFMFTNSEDILMVEGMGQKGTWVANSIGLVHIILW